ncbi:MAG: Calx-beta domain-containing protein [Cyanobacteria bacterium P01_A01_bin.135]
MAIPQAPITFNFPNLNPSPGLVLDNYIEATFGDGVPVLMVGDDGDTGTITFTFMGESDRYDIEATYFDEEAGGGSLTLSSGATVLKRIRLNGAVPDPNTDGPDDLFFDRRSVGTVSLAEGQQLTLTGVGDGQESAPIQSLTFSPIPRLGLPPEVVFDNSLLFVDEDTGSAVIRVTRRGCIDLEREETVTVTLTDAEPGPSNNFASAATAGADYVATPIEITFAAGESSATALVPILDDAIDEVSEGILLSINNSFAGIATAVIVIEDNDPSPSRIPGTAASEVLEGTNGEDIISGAAGDDILKGFGSRDQLDGGEGRDSIFGGDGSDEIDGGAARDFINGDRADDLLDGGSDRDYISGGEGDDQVIGSAGRDILEGNKGDDILFGGQGADRIQGNKGNDVMRGGDGSDTLRGGAGADVYVVERAPGVDQFEGFQRGTDMLRIAGGLTFEDLNIQVTGSSTVIRLQNTGERLAVVVGADVSDASNFTVVG